MSRTFAAQDFTLENDFQGELREPVPVPMSQNKLDVSSSKRSIIPMISRIPTKKSKKLILEKKKSQKKDVEKYEPKVYENDQPSSATLFLDTHSYGDPAIKDDNNQFLCQAEGCGRRFGDNSKLKRHMLIHTDAKPNKCELCNTRFSFDFSLRTHLRIHAGEKPYVCTYKNCNKRFSQLANLSAHTMRHFVLKHV